MVAVTEPVRLTEEQQLANALKWEPGITLDKLRKIVEILKRNQVKPIEELFAELLAYEHRQDYGGLTSKYIRDAWMKSVEFTWRPR